MTGRNVKVKTFFVFILIIALTFTFAGCGQGNSDSEEGSVTITYAMWQTNLTSYMKERIAAFEKENPNIKVKLKTYENYQQSASEYWKDMNAAKTEDLPDVFQMSPDYFAEYCKDGKLLALDSTIKSSKLIKMDNLPQYLTELYKVDGKQYGIPIDYDTICLWYNKELFDRAGIKYPNTNWTWTDFVNASAKIDALGSGTYGFIAVNIGQLGYYNTVAGCGGYIVKDEKFGFSDKKTQEGIKLWKDMTKYSPTLAQIDKSGGPHMLFMKGKVGMVYGGDWEAADFTSKDSVVSKKINVAELPSIKGKKTSIICGKANVVSAGTKHKEAALKLIDFLSSSESFEKLGKTGKCIPADRNYSQTFFDQYSQYDMGVFQRAAVDYSVAYPISSKTDWKGIEDKHMADILNNKVSVSEGCRLMMNELSK